jgi:hypothetical protein
MAKIRGPWFLFLLLLILIIFHQWFTFQIISAGDYLFLFKENLLERFSFPLTWNKGYQAPFLNSYPIIFLTGFFSRLGLDFVLIERLVWFWPFLILTPLSAWYLAKTLFPKKTTIHFLAPLIYFFNTYSLMIIGGGQVGISLSYALAPLVLAVFVRNIRENNLRLKIMAGLILAVQVVFDPRLAIITIGAVFLYALFQLGRDWRRYFEVFIPPLLITLGIHFYWLLPTILTKKAVLPAGYGQTGWAEFLSFADFSDSLSLLHPNWPENIFGKTYFMRPEFLLVPSLAFVSLWFLAKIKDLKIKREILFLALLALSGTFLAKGAKPPFGGVYLWLFNYFPGLNFFRDPVKFYLLVALSYSLLIPFSLDQISHRFKKRPNFKYLLLFFFVVSWLFLIKPAWLGQLGGTFKTKELPKEYKTLKEFLGQQEEFFRVLWLPQKQRFGFESQLHPALESPELPSEEKLAILGVKYVIIPFDSEGEIFLKDRKYDCQQRLELEEELAEVGWLEKIEVADKIAVYQTPQHHDRFFVPDKEELSVNWQMINPTRYLVQISGMNQSFDLIFSETYDELWQTKIGKRLINSKEFEGLNSFSLDQTGKLVVEYKAQEYPYWGGMVSLLTLLGSFGVLVCLRKD